ncbi:DUF6274 family protein [Streptomyces sp. KR80]|uniref:DUF6274 family protein n=1 Tax=Streptomyces sp. KR80 TaxID=3457426 RepID=UPI003FD60B90
MSARHETRALLRAHLSAATSYRHLTRHCPVCHQLLRLAMEAGGNGVPPVRGPEPGRDAEADRRRGEADRRRADRQADEAHTERDRRT